jgi:hypothetical protein
MINKGDKLICIKDISHYATGNIRFRKGKSYEIKKSNEDGIFLTPEDGDRDCTITLQERTEEFLTIAEWRERQINSILDE